MKNLKETNLHGIFLVVVVIGVLVGVVAFSNIGAPTAFATTQPKISGFSIIVADAGPNQTAKLRQAVTLDASNSTGRITYYSWQIKTPDKKTIDKFGRRVTFTADKLGIYNATLKVSAGRDVSSTDYSIITVRAAIVPRIAR